LSAEVLYLAGSLVYRLHDPQQYRFVDMPTGAANNNFWNRHTLWGVLLMNRKLLASAICTSLLVAGTAFAQDTTPANPPQDQTTTAPQTDQSDQQNPQTLETVTVTGSLLKRPEYQTIVPIQVVNVQAQKAAGAFSTADILQTTAVAAATTQINNQFSGFVIGGGTGIQTIDLRGLGSNRTLVLLDGQRPGPAGTQGQTGAGFDLNVIPDVIIQRIEIVKDGSSSLYGSDAISGVVNMITKKSLDHLELSAVVAVPQHSGGTQTTASIGTGWNFDNGNILVAAQFSEQFPLAYGDRSFLSCPQDLVWGAGKRIDRTDKSILQGTSLAGCNNLYANTIIDYYDAGIRFVPTVGGGTVGPFPGYHPRPFPTPRYDDGNPNGAYYEDVLNFPFADDAWAINRNRNSSLYASSRFTFGTVNWTNQFLYNHRQTDTRGWRQFFPIVLGPTDTENTAVNPYYGIPNNQLPFGIYEPIMPFPSNGQVKVDYYYLRTGFDGGFGDSSWSWQVNATHSRSDGDYSHFGIDARKSGDLSYGVNEVPPGSAQIDRYFTPGYLSGQDMGQLMQDVGRMFTGNTVYTQSTANAIATGNLFELPAGPVTAAVGAEYRHYKINDVPDAANSAGYEWGYSSAQVTEGADHVTEEFGELGVPVLSGVPGFQSLALDLSARRFKYATVGSSDKVWKYGLNWQITDTWRIRGTIGTSYRAPGLYELYLGNQSGFLAQTAIDPCIDWNNSTSDFIKANCGAAGIPANYQGGGSSAQIFTGGGAGFLKPETSRAKSIGFVWTPTFGNFNLAVDYFDYKILGEIGSLSAGAILNSCYGVPVYPNAFCDLFNRNPPNAANSPNAITDVFATFININRQRTRGYDVQVNYSDDFSFGRLSADLQLTYTIENTQQLFDSSVASGFNSTDFVGYIGSPRLTGLAHVTLEHGNWTWTLQEHYVSSTEDTDLTDTFNYFGYPDAIRDIKAKYQFRTDLSLGYDTGKWGAIFGIRNLFDTAPDLVSTGVGNAGYFGTGRIGNIPSQSSQYDWFGRTFFARINYKL
jgi:iron complex outermembrane receptor protein